MGRPHSERLLFDLNSTRTELETEAGKLKPEDLEYSPEPDLGMKSCKALLQEIGTMEKICMTWTTHQEMLGWETAVAWSGNTAESTLKDLAAIRAETLAYLNASTEETLETPIPVPSEWREYFSGDTIEPEEMIRWVIRHEYYHLGQLITYRWILGDNPYKPSGS